MEREREREREREGERERDGETRHPLRETDLSLAPSPRLLGVL